MSELPLALRLLQCRLDIELAAIELLIIKVLHCVEGAVWPVLVIILVLRAVADERVLLGCPKDACDVPKFAKNFLDFSFSPAFRHVLDKDVVVCPPLVSP